MNSKSLNSFRNLFFFLIVSLGLIYTLILVKGLGRSMSGFVMQLIFLLDILKTQPLLSLKLIFSSQFVFNVGFGFTILFLSLKYLNALLRSLLNFNLTQKTIKNLIIIKSNKKYFIFKSTQPQAFTVGFFLPKIYISTSLIRKSTDIELKAVYRHELKHKMNLDPLKDFIINFISLSLPPFFGKKKFFGQYSALVEINCDSFAQLKLKSSLPLVSALLKTTSSHSVILETAAYFSSQSERIKVLVGESRLKIKQLFLMNSFILVFAIFSLNLVTNTNLFYNCEHVLKCVQIFLSENKQTKLVNSSPVSVSPVMDHCPQC
ncbi:MAG: M56 family metallopeptidase [Candidatus Shapirobacteria bacterium]|nr:M56 family metallopeptidase [Candidatus Shapirobacteria bacterium]